MTAEYSDSHSDGTVVDVKLFRAIGLFHILNFTAQTGRDGYDGRRHRTVLRVYFWLVIVTIIFNIGGMYLSYNDFQRFTYLTLCVTVSLPCSLKSYVLSRKADTDRLRAVLDMARYAFTSCGRSDPSRLSRRSAALSALLRTFVTINYCTVFFWMLAPFFIHASLSVTHLDGTVSEYRNSILNLWVPLPDAAYNSSAGWSVVYAYEAIVFTGNLIILLMFDCYVLTTCFALNAHFRTLVDGYTALGRRTPGPTLGDEYYSRLICLVDDNQRVVKKFYDFYDVVQSVVKLQIACSTVSGIISIFFAILMFMSGWSLVSPPVLKFFSAYVIVMAQLGIYCFAFSYVETAKSAVNFGLYSSDWTAKDLKFKKTMLLAMKMNSSYQRIAKLTPTNTINLEMLYGVIKTSYSIVSLLLNTAVELKAEE
ncbi:Olfactory receptor, insect [Cinara cedri]|uniref:Odorant receptor n=1 Tax=Cinara cedri TaxID=506608 RepID=A0A5E4N5C2_9HEMI|nr:Olfactory receptor, insect [Cinara cedri]